MAILQDNSNFLRYLETSRHTNSIVGKSVHMDDRPGPGRFKCKFAPAEDLRLAEVVQWCGCGNWAVVARQMPGRNPRQCRERWMNYINPFLDRTLLTPGEERLLEEKLAAYGTQWQLIVSFFPGRGKNFIKNHWISKQKHLERMSRDTALRERREQPPKSSETNQDDFGGFDALFQDEETQNIFWEKIASGHM
jgi:hypothetical protein